MFSKSLIQFSVDGWGYVPSLLFNLRSNYGGGNEDYVHVLQKFPCMIALPHSVPPTCSWPPLTHAFTGDFWTLTGKSGSVSCGSLLFSPGKKLENLAVAIRLENVGFHSNPKEGQCQRMLKVKVKVKSLSHVRLFETPWTVACNKILSPSDFQDKSTGVGCHFHLQRMFKLLHSCIHLTR